MGRLRITGVELREVTYEVRDVGPDPRVAYLPVYRPGLVAERRVPVFRIFTDGGVTGEYAGGSTLEAAGARTVAGLLIGKNPLERERIYNDVKRALRKHDRMGIGPLDIALWDMAGKCYGAPIFELLGGCRREPALLRQHLPGDHERRTRLSPEAFADFAMRCRELGYPAFKIHGGGEGDVDARLRHRPRRARGRWRPDGR